MRRNEVLKELEQRIVDLRKAVNDNPHVFDGLEFQNKESVPYHASKAHNFFPQSIVLAFLLWLGKVIGIH